VIRRERNARGQGDPGGQHQGRVGRTARRHPINPVLRFVHVDGVSALQNPGAADGSLGSKPAPSSAARPAAFASCGHVGNVDAGQHWAKNGREQVQQILNNGLGCVLPLCSEVHHHNPTRRISFSLCRRLRDFVGVLDEQPRGWAERAVLQGNGPDRHAG
jgi:hypothetical protein